MVLLAHMDAVLFWERKRGRASKSALVSTLWKMEIQGETTMSEQNKPIGLSPTEPEQTKEQIDPEI